MFIYKLYIYHNDRYYSESHNFSLLFFIFQQEFMQFFCYWNIMTIAKKKKKIS